MKRWSLKTCFGLAAACLSVLALVAGLLVARPLIYRHQLAEIDDQLQRNAEELFRDMKGFAGAAPDLRKPLPEKFIPAVMNGRYLQVQGKDGVVLHRSANLRGFVLAGEPDTLRTVVITGRNCRVGTFSSGFFSAHVGIRLGSVEAMQEDMLMALLWIAPGLGLVVFGLGWLLGRLALRPVTRLIAAAEKIDTRAPEERLPLPAAQDEIFRLTEVLNSSFDRLQHAYASAARFSADASHQLKTPLAVLRAGLDNLRAQPALAPETRAEVDALLKQTRRLTTLTEDLLLLAQIDAGHLRLEAESLDLAALARAALDDLEALAPARGLSVESAIPEALPARGDARRVALILQNLTENAAKYAGAGGRIRIVCAATNDGAGVSVTNTGPAIPQDSRARLFERFYRAGAGENISGHGLGLNIARALAQAMQGDVQLVRSDDEGTEFSLTLPLAEMVKMPGA